MQLDQTSIRVMFYITQQGVNTDNLFKTNAEEMLKITIMQH